MLQVLTFHLIPLRSMLFNHCECPEEGTRNVVSECLGKLTLIDPANLLSNLKNHLNSQSALTRSTVVTAIKFTISDQVSVMSRWGLENLTIRKIE